MADNYDLAVLGAGPGGYVAAIKASQLGLKTVVIEKEHLGGICLNWGCIPTKALLRSAEMYKQMKHSSVFGIKAENISFDIAAIVKRSRTVSSRLSMGIKHLLKKNEIDVIDGYGRLDGHKIVVDSKDGEKKEIAAKHIIIATGASPRSLPDMEFDGEYILDYRKAMTPEELPASMVIVGSGAIGVEFASLYSAFGVKVTVVELMDRILPLEDEDISDFVFKAMKRSGVKFLTGTKLKSISKEKQTVTVEAGGEETEIPAEKVIVAVGVKPNISDIGLETTSVKTEKGSICVNEWLETDDKGIYAIGDVTKPPLLAHKASHEAIICVEKIAGAENVKSVDYKNIPSCVYCTPQVASIGLTEAEAIKEGYSVKVGSFPYAGNGKAVAMGEAQGIVKTVADAKTSKILGVHMAGAEVTELVSNFSVAKSMDAGLEEMSHVVFPHPTLSEMLHESVLAALGKAIHI